MAGTYWLWNIAVNWVSNRALSLSVPWKLVIVSFGSFTTDDFSVSSFCLITASIFYSSNCSPAPWLSHGLDFARGSIPRFLSRWDTWTILQRYPNDSIFSRLDLRRPQFHILVWLTSGELRFLDRYSKTIYLSGHSKNEWVNTLFIVGF